MDLGKLLLFFPLYFIHLSDRAILRFHDDAVLNTVILGTSKCIHSIEYNVEIPSLVLVLRKFQIMLKNEKNVNAFLVLSKTLA